MNWPKFRLLQLWCRRSFLAAIALACVGVGSAAAQFGTFSDGGGPASSAQYTAQVTLGQTFVGTALSTGYRVSGGFLAAVDMQAPTGTLPSVGGPADQNLMVRAHIVDSGAMIAVTLHYRLGGDIEFIEKAMDLVELETGDRAAAIPAEHVTSRGVQYYVTATDGVHTTTIPAGAPIQLAEPEVYLADHPVCTTTAGQYGMYGISMYAEDRSPEAILGSLGAYDPARWRFGIYDPDEQEYREGTTAGQCEPGQGFWLITQQSESIAASGRNTPLSGSVTLHLRAGFNQIANPYDFPIDWSSVHPDYDVDAFLYGWNGSGYDAFSHTTMEPGRGYWVYARTGGLKLRLPARPSASEPAGEKRSPERLATDEGGWSVRVKMSAGSWRSEGTCLGVRPGATSDRDAFDFFAAPPPPGVSRQVYLRDGQGRRLLSDYRDPASRGETWELVVDAERSESDTGFSITFEMDRALPDGWSLRALEMTDLREEDLLAGTSLRGSFGSGQTNRSWRIVAGDDTYLKEARETALEDINLGVDRLALRPAYPNPFGIHQGTSISFTVPRSTHVALRVYDVRGRVVRTLLDEKIEPGLRRIEWAGRDDAGRRAASGMYFLRLTTEEASRIRKVLFVR